MIHKIVRRQTVDDSHLPPHLPPLLKQLYARRGVTLNECELVLKGLLRPDTMKGLNEAAKLIGTDDGGESVEELHVESPVAGSGLRQVKVG